MAKARRKGMAVAGWILVVLILGGLAFWGVYAEKKAVFTPEVRNGPLGNPMSGFAPCADYHEIVGEHQLVYVDVTWRELEPQQGRFDFASIEEENHLNEWRVKGKQVVFRFLCDVPGSEKHMDIPDWLYEATSGDGDWYNTDYGQGYSPNYNNPIMIGQHKEAIEALGNRFGRDDFFCYIELGSLGHWGEWHTKFGSGIDPLPLEDVRDQYIQPYLESFSNAMVMMRRPFRAAAEHNMGLFNDMTGDPASTAEWLQWIRLGGAYGETGEGNALVPMADSWKTAPVGGEFTSGISMQGLLQGSLERTIGLIRESHMTFIGPKGPVLPEDMQYTEGIDAVLSSLGSRLRVARVAMSQPLLLPGDLTVQLDWVNDGSAPFYRDWEVVLTLLDSNGQEVIRQPVDIDIRNVVDANPITSETTIPARDLPEDSYALALALIDPATGYPAYTFAMEGMRLDQLCILGQWQQD